MVQGFLYKDQLRIAAETDALGNVVSQFVYADDKSHSPDFMIKGGGVYRLLKDQLGSPRVVVNVLTGAIAQILEFDELGIVLTDSTPGFQPIAFAGGLYDQDTGLVQFGSRDYDSAVGRWMSKDPIIFLGDTANLFQYTIGDSVNLTDPTGMLMWCGSPNTWYEPYVPPAFPDACRHHDACYERCGTPKEYCDDTFYGEALQTCGPNMLCRIFAKAYYDAEKYGGGSAYLKAQADCKPHEPDICDGVTRGI
jgi:RHS repeat-associated protein